MEIPFLCEPDSRSPYELNPDEEGNYAGVIDLSRFNYKPGTYYVNVRAVEQSKREYDINCMEINVP